MLCQINYYHTIPYHACIDMYVTYSGVFSLFHYIILFFIYRCIYYSEPHKENYIINYTIDNYTNSFDYKLFI